MDTLRTARSYVAQAGGLREALNVPADAPLQVESLAQGEHNANFILTTTDSRRFVLRINYSSQMGLDDQIGYEFAALKALSNSGRTPQPLYVDSTKAVIPHGVLVETYLPGVLLDLENTQQVQEVAHILADIHAVQAPDGCGLFQPNDPLQAQLDNSHVFFANYCESEFAESEVIDRVQGFFERAEAALAHYRLEVSGSRGCHIINTEAVPSHFIFDHDGFGHMVDWEKPILGDAAQDVAYFLSPTSTIWDSEIIFSAEERTAFVDTYCEAVAGRFPLEQFKRLLPLYVMTNALIGITWSCNAWVEYHDPARPLKNEKTFNKLGIYFESWFLNRIEELCF